jgi:hypothetical protein
MSLEVATNQAVCERCEYRWNPKSADPKECPQCKSRRWNDPERITDRKAWKMGPPIASPPTPSPKENQP